MTLACTLLGSIYGHMDYEGLAAVIMQAAGRDHRSLAG
jgi:hypothetical protein